MSDRDPVDRAPGPRPERQLAVPPTRVAGRRAGLGAGLVLVTGIAAIAAAVLLAQPGAARPVAGSPQPSSTRAASGGAEPVEPPAVGAGRAIPPRLSRADLTVAVIDGSLDGTLVFVDGELRSTPVRCQSLAQAPAGCVNLEIPGLGLPVWAGPSALPWRGDPPRGAWIVTVARTGGLVYLGSLLPDPEPTDSLARLTRRLLRAELAEPPRTLFEVQSWLVLDRPAPCYRNSPTATPCPSLPPFLARDEPFPDGTLRDDRGGPVDLADPVVGLEPGVAVTEGRFLVTLPDACAPADAAATCPEDLRWLVVARYEPERSIRVLVP